MPPPSKSFQRAPEAQALFPTSDTPVNAVQTVNLIGNSSRP
jgi:hypothetical protein